MNLYLWNWKRGLSDLRIHKIRDGGTIYLVFALILNVLYNDLIAYADMLTGTYIGRSYGISPFIVCGYLLGYFILMHIQRRIADEYFLARLCLLWFSAEIRFFLYFIISILIIELLSLKYIWLDIGIYQTSSGALYRSIYFQIGYYLKGAFIFYGFITSKKLSRSKLSERSSH